MLVCVLCMVTTVATATEVVYTCPPNCVAEVTFIHVVNGGGSTNSVDVEWYVAADDYTSHFLSGKSLNCR
jgi:hypothetical protein